jgi:type I restriction enzyme, S subunit
VKDNWQQLEIGDVIVPSGTIDPTKEPDNEFQYVDVSSVSNETFSIDSSSKIFGRDAPSRARRLIKSGDVIFATIRPTLKRIAMVPPEFDGEVCSTGYFVFRTKPFLDSRFLFYHLFSENFMSAMETQQTGASYPAVNDAQVRKQLINFPPLPEQRRIVAILDEAFAGLAVAAANAEKNLKNAREVFESYLNSVFNQKGEDWREKTLKQISIDFGRGKSKHRPRGDARLLGGKYPLIQTGDVANSDHYICEYSQTYSEFGLAQSKLWPKGTVCIAIVGANVAETAILGFEACFPDSVIGLVVDESLADCEYVEFLLQTFKAMLKERGKGTARDNINLATFENQRFPFPDVIKQKRIVARLNEMAEQTTRLESVSSQKLAAIAELKQALLQKAFAGKLTKDNKYNVESGAPQKFEMAEDLV